ncbi:MAG: LuxR C-terminal-related transcriptional regulator [bacterium]
MLNSTPNVYVVDADAASRASLAFLIRQEGWTPRCFESAAGLLAASSPVVPSCVLLDPGMAERGEAEVQRSIASDRGATPVIVLTARHDVPLTVRAMKAGAIEVLTKPCAGDALARVIALALEHSRELLESQKELRGLRERYQTLTPREREVMMHVVAGRLNKHVASTLFISVITVKAHRGRVMRKMRADSLADLVGMALRLQLAHTMSPNGINELSHHSASFVMS